MVWINSCWWSGATDNDDEVRRLPPLVAAATPGSTLLLLPSVAEDNDEGGEWLAIPSGARVNQTVYIFSASDATRGTEEVYIDIF